jgi:hypothetical protein
MRKLRWMGVVSLVIGLTALAGVTETGRGRGVDQGGREQFVGAWRLASLELKTPSLARHHRWIVYGEVQRSINSTELRETATGPLWTFAQVQWTHFHHLSC